jgi:hypothetical protein
MESNAAETIPSPNKNLGTLNVYPTMAAKNEPIKYRISVPVNKCGLASFTRVFAVVLIMILPLILSFVQINKININIWLINISSLIAL